MSSVSNQLMMNQFMLNQQLLNQTYESSVKIKEIKTDNDLSYAKDGDAKYDKAMDSDGDGIISYDEYMEYCKQNASSTPVEKNTTTVDENSETFQTKNVVKDIEKYMKIAYPENNSKITAEA